MAQKPSIPKGTRDFSPMEMAKRNYIFDTIKQVYQLYGFQQIETPAMETLGTLMGKYGEEGDKLLFKVLNSGDFLTKVSDEELQERNALHLAAKLCEKGESHLEHLQQIVLPVVGRDIFPHTECLELIIAMAYNIR